MGSEVGIVTNVPFVVICQTFVLALTSNLLKSGRFEAQKPVHCVQKR